MNRQMKYAGNYKQVKVCFRKGKDDKYIEFLNNIPNKTEFIRKAIDQALK